MFVSVNVYTNHCAFLNFLHGSLFVDESRCHEVGPFEHKFDGSLIGCVTRVHVRIGMYGLESGDTVLIYENEMVLFINNDVLRFVVITSSNFIDEHFAFLGEKDLNLFFPKIRPFVQTGSILLDGRFAGGSLMPSMLNVPQHLILILIQKYIK